MKRRLASCGYEIHDDGADGTICNGGFETAKNRSPNIELGLCYNAKSPSVIPLLRVFNDDMQIHVIEIFVVHLFFFFRFVDESPRWLFSQGRYQESGAIIRKMLIQNGKADAIPEQGFSVDQLQQALSTTTSGIDKEPLEQPVTNITPVQEGGKELMTVAIGPVSSSDRKYGIIDLFKTPRLRNRTLNISLNW